MDDSAELHKCTEFDQLNTCKECGTPKHTTPRANRAVEEEYRQQIEKLASR